MLKVHQTQLHMSIRVSEMEPVSALGCLVSNLYEKTYHATYVLRHLVLNVRQFRNAGNM